MYSGVMSWGANTNNTSDGWRKGPWTAQEDQLLVDYVKVYGEGRWNNVARFAGLRRNGKSCRLRWVNYLRPDLKKGQITPHEEKIIVELHAKLGNRWSQIAKSLEGRTDNEIKNYWRTHFKKKTKSDPEKEKERLQRRQQFQLQQYQLLCRQFEQGQADDMVNFTPWVNESHNRAANDTNCMAQDSVLPNAIDEQGFAYQYPIIDNYTTIATDSNENIIWDDGLWGFDDLMDNFGTSNY